MPTFGRPPVNTGHLIDLQLPRLDSIHYLPLKFALVPKNTQHVNEKIFFFIKSFNLHSPFSLQMQKSLKLTSTEEKNMYDKSSQ